MNFYEFNDNDYEYYGLVLAINEEALEKYKKAEIDGLITEGEKIKDFKETVKNFNKYTSKSKEPFIVLLIDGYLL